MIPGSCVYDSLAFKVYKFWRVKFGLKFCFQLHKIQLNKNFFSNKQGYRISSCMHQKPKGNEKKRVVTQKHPFVFAHEAKKSSKKDPHVKVTHFWGQAPCLHHQQLNSYSANLYITALCCFPLSLDLPHGFNSFLHQYSNCASKLMPGIHILHLRWQPVCLFFQRPIKQHMGDGHRMHVGSDGRLQLRGSPIFSKNCKWFSAKIDREMNF